MSDLAGLERSKADEVLEIFPGLTKGGAEVICELAEERIRQNLKWGEQNRSMDRWVCIETEELGEAAHEADEWDKLREKIEINRRAFSRDDVVGADDSVADAWDAEQQKRLDAFEYEMSQVMAVAAVAVESIRRQRDAGDL